ncbi:HAD family hydrolase [Alkalilimnicola sp. S0819]|uniref:HAD family hydrolase n=1 Tax=Alkalilimnicola sp. S0819 TaxID=2613922 RepID=UPI0012622336|nr:HAD family hydrolase [Alkalilimnicola sp. S0819]KAB7622548.1 HAD family hydrolase [Alkalilimnicola sp. S0819]MPQ17435.1 HAD-IA family hydrolase [Alkalilimnicola sp. S0819]
MHLRAVSFDLDHTLWGLEGVLPRAEARGHEWLRTHYPDAAARYSPEQLTAIRQELLRSRPELRHHVSELRKAVYREVARACGYGEALVEGAFEAFLQARHEITLYPEAKPLLDSLRGRYRLGVMTNGNANVHRLGLGHYFDFVVAAIDVGAAKPDRLIFEAACHRAGVPASQMVHIGDEPESDVIGAAGYGMRAVWLNQEGRDWPRDLEPVPHVEVRSLAEFGEWLAGEP